MPVIADAKRADIGPTSEQYAKEFFDYYSFDAITLNPYMGEDSLIPFLQHKDKGCIILCKTSNNGATDFQELLVDNKPLYMHVAQKIQKWNSTYNNCMLVVGATWIEQLKEVRLLCPDMFILIPGIGAQGGDLKKTLEVGLRTDKSGIIIHSSRSILYTGSSTNFAKKSREEANKVRDIINQYRI